MYAAVPYKNSNILSEQDYSTSKLRSSSSFFLSRLSSSLACSLRPGLTSSAPPSGCCKPGTWVREGFSCCLEGVVEAQTLWAGAAAVLREIEADEISRKMWKSNNQPASQQPSCPACHFCTFDQFCHQIRGPCFRFLKSKSQTWGPWFKVLLAAAGARRSWLVLWKSLEVVKRPPLCTTFLLFSCADKHCHSIWNMSPRVVESLRSTVSRRRGSDLGVRKPRGRERWCGVQLHTSTNLPPGATMIRLSLVPFGSQVNNQSTEGLGSNYAWPSDNGQAFLVLGLRNPNVNYVNMLNNNGRVG